MPVTYIYEVFQSERLKIPNIHACLSAFMPILSLPLNLIEAMDTRYNDIIPSLIVNMFFMPQTMFLFIVFLAYLYISVYGGRVAAYPLMTTIIFAIPFFAANYDHALGRETTVLGPVASATIILGLFTAAIPSIFSAYDGYRGWFATAITYVSLYIAFIVLECNNLNLRLAIRSAALYPVCVILMAASVYITHHYSKLHLYATIQRAERNEKALPIMAKSEGLDREEQRYYVLEIRCPNCLRKGSVDIESSLLYGADNIILRCKYCDKPMKIRPNDIIVSQEE